MIDLVQSLSILCLTAASIFHSFAILRLQRRVKELEGE